MKIEYFSIGTIFFMFQELYGLDVLHKFNWIRLIARMFEAMAGKFDHPMIMDFFSQKDFLFHRLMRILSSQIYNLIFQGYVKTHIF